MYLLCQGYQLFMCFCHDNRRNRKTIVYSMCDAMKVLLICKIDLLCKYVFFNDFNYHIFLEHPVYKDKTYSENPIFMSEP